MRIWIAFACLAVLPFIGVCAESHGVEAIFGNWTVAKVLPTNAISALTTAGANAYIGKRVVFGRARASFGQAVLASPIYKEAAVTAETFFDRTHIALDQIGIRTVQAREITVYQSPGKLWSEPVRYILVKDNDHLIVGYKGTFWELRRSTNRR